MCHCKFEDCKRDVFSGFDDFCIFHSEDISGKKATFDKMFSEEVNEQKRNTSDSYMFYGFRFPNDFTLSNYFPNKVIDRKIQFWGANFNGRADFQHVKFNGVVMFHGAVFEGDVFFGKAQFKDKVYFCKRVSFEKEADFSDSMFLEEVDFSDVEFVEKADFCNSRFHGTADFLEAAFLSLSEFDSSEFYGNVHFTAATFHGVASFHNAHFKKRAYFLKTIFTKKCDFQKTRFDGETDFEGTECQNIACFDEAQFHGQTKLSEACDLNHYRLGGVYFYNLINLVPKIEEAISKKEMPRFHYTYPKIVNFLMWPIILVKKIFYKEPINLVTEFVTKNIYLVFGYQTACRYPIADRAIKDDIYLLEYNRKHPKLFFFWWLLSDFGRSWARWAYWAVLIILLFGTIFSPPPEIFGEWWSDLCNKFGPKFIQSDAIAQQQPTSFWSMLYLSVITFTSFGFDSSLVAANGMARLLICVEIVFGYVMLGGLIGIFTNKLSRRS